MIIIMNIEKEIYIQIRVMKMIIIKTIAEEAITIEENIHTEGNIIINIKKEIEIIMKIEDTMIILIMKITNMNIIIKDIKVEV